MTIKIIKQFSSKKSRTDFVISNSKNHKQPAITISTTFCINDYIKNSRITGRSQIGLTTKISMRIPLNSHKTNHNTTTNALLSSPTRGTSPLCCHPKITKAQDCSSVPSSWDSMPKCSARICRNPRRSSCVSWRKIPTWVTMNQCVRFTSITARRRVNRNSYSCSWVRWKRLFTKCILKHRGCQAFFGWWRSKRTCGQRLGSWRICRTWWWLSWSSDVCNICRRIDRIVKL